MKSEQKAVRTHPIHTVDVFSEGRYSGNQLAVILDAGDLGGEVMQQIALEMNYSETTFVVGNEPSAEGYRVRIFTPQAELEFAGHPTIGTAYIIREYLAEGSPDTITLDLDIGPIPVSVDIIDDEEIFWMDQVAPEFGYIIDPGDAAEIINVDQSQIDTEFICQIVSTGLPTLIIPLESLDAVRDVEINQTEYQKFVDQTATKVVLVFSTETVNPDNDLHVRLFGPALGVPEDPATGSGNGCLAGYLSRYQFFGTSSIEAKVEQGYEINRPSLIHIEAQSNDRIDISVGGCIEPVIRGELL